MIHIWFLTAEHILAIHADQIARYGGNPEIVSEQTLEAVLYQPQATVDGIPVHRPYFEMAAAYVYYIIQAKPFADANERVAYAAAVTFLNINGFMVYATAEEASELLSGVWHGRLGKNDITAFFETHAMKSGSRA